MRAILLLASTLLFAAPALTAPGNLAPQATVSASSEYDRPPARLLAENAIDGVIPELFDKNDWEYAWAVYGPEANGRATFSLEGVPVSLRFMHK